MNAYHTTTELPSLFAHWFSNLLKLREEMLLLDVADARETDCWWPQR